MVILIAVFATLLALAAPAAADCMSVCESAYVRCTNIDTTLSCSSRRSICQQGCILHGSKKYGAIAYSPSTGQYGYSFDYMTRGDAERRALKGCRQGRDPGDCATEIWFFANCGALATGPHAIRGAAYAASEAAARKRAMQACTAQSKGKACEIKASVCSK